MGPRLLAEKDVASLQSSDAMIGGDVMDFYFDRLEANNATVTFVGSSVFPIISATPTAPLTWLPLNIPFSLVFVHNSGCHWRLCVLTMTQSKSITP